MKGKAACILVIAGGSRPDIDECLLSLAESTYSPSFTIVVDNSPSGLDSLKTAFPGVATVRPPDRLTFAQAANLGMKNGLARGARLIFLLNDDVTVHANALGILAETEAQLGPGIFAPEIWPYERVYRRMRFIIDWKKRLAVRVPVALNGSLTKLDYAEGSALLVSTEVIDKIGFFDEDFGFYYEDADFSVRADDAGFPVYEVEGARVWHKGSVSAGKGLSPFKAYYRARNTMKFAMKHRRRARVFSNAIHHFGGFVIPEVLRSSLKTLIGSRTDAQVLAALARGTWDFFTGNGHLRPAEPRPDLDDEISRLPLMRQAGA